MKIFKIVVIALIVLGIPALAYFGYKQMNKVSKDYASVSDSTKTVEEKLSGTFNDIMKAGMPVKCSYDVTMESGSSIGTIYISGENMRLDTTVTTAESAIENRSIKIGNTLYAWDPITLVGYQMEVTEDMIADEAETEEMTDSDIPDSIKALQNDFEYNCKPWIIDGSVFEIPENVTFTDMSALTKGIEEAQESGDYCAMCESLPDAQKAECLVNFGCN